MWNMNLQRTFGSNLLVEAAYIGSRGMRIWNNYNRAATYPQYLSMGTRLNTLVPNPFYGKIAIGTMSTATVRQGVLLSPYPQYAGSINQIRASVGDSVYHGFTLRAERSYSSGLMFQVSYTAAKLIDNVNERFLGGANFINPYDLGMSRSISAADVSQRLVANWVYELPFGKGKKYLSQGIGGMILGNWQTSGILSAQTGTPISIVAACIDAGRVGTGLLCRPVEDLHPAGGAAEHGPLVRHDGLRQPGGLLLRQRLADGADSAQPWNVRLRRRAEPLAADHGARAAAVSRRVLQHAQPPEPGRAQREHHLVHLRRDHDEERQPHHGHGAAAGVLATWLERRTMQGRDVRIRRGAVLRRAAIHSPSDYRGGSRRSRSFDARWEGAARLPGLVQLPGRRIAGQQLAQLGARHPCSRDSDHRHVPRSSRNWTQMKDAPVPEMTIGGSPAYLYSAWNRKTVERHFLWMKQYGLDGVLVQRFVTGIAGKRASGDVVLKNIIAGAVKHGRTFAIEYDITGSDPVKFADIMYDDWKYLVDELKVTSHSNYQRHAGKPVLSIWGMGLHEDRHVPHDPKVAAQVIAWFKSGADPKYRVTYMGGTPARWRTLTADARPEEGWAEVYQAMDVIQPWTVGRYRDGGAADKWSNEFIAPDLALTKKNSQLYMPVVFPGFSWYNLKREAPKNAIPRNRGEFLWRQAYNAKAAGATMLKIAMFDEVNEATAIFKVASRRDQAPDQGFWLTLDADGADLPSDWYLRLAGEITRMFHGEIKPDPKLPKDPGRRNEPATAAIERGAIRRSGKES